MGALEGGGPGKGASMDLLEPGYFMEEFGSYSVTDEVLSWPPHLSGFCQWYLYLNLRGHLSCLCLFGHQVLPFFFFPNGFHIG